MYISIFREKKIGLTVKKKKGVVLVAGKKGGLFRYMQDTILSSCLKGIKYLNIRAYIQTILLNILKIGISIKRYSI